VPANSHAAAPYRGGEHGAAAPVYHRAEAGRGDAGSQVVLGVGLAALFLWTPQYMLFFVWRVGERT